MKLPLQMEKSRSAHASNLKWISLTPEVLGGGGRQIDHPLNFFGFIFLLLDRLSKALIQLFFVC